MKDETYAFEAKIIQRQIGDCDKRLARKGSDWEYARISSYRDGWDSARNKIFVLDADKFKKWLVSRIHNVKVVITALKKSSGCGSGLTRAKIASLESELSALDTVLQIIDVNNTSKSLDDAIASSLRVDGEIVGVSGNIKYRKSERETP